MDAEQYSKLKWKCPDCGSTSPSVHTRWESILAAGVGPYCRGIVGGIGCVTSRRMILTQPNGVEGPANPVADTVNHPAHYNQTKVECIEVVNDLIATLPAGDGYCVGAILKYLWRYPTKGGVESLRKARWYLDCLIALVEKREAAEKK